MEEGLNKKPGDTPAAAPERAGGKTRPAGGDRFWLPAQLSGQRFVYTVVGAGAGPVHRHQHEPGPVLQFSMRLCEVNRELPLRKRNWRSGDAEELDKTLFLVRSAK